MSPADALVLALVYLDGERSGRAGADYERDAALVIDKLEQHGFAVGRPSSALQIVGPVLPDHNGENGAEAVVAYLHGNRAHPIVVADIDRRTAPKNWQAGESGLWHHKGATAKLTATGWKHDAGPDRQPHTVVVGNAVLTIADGKITAQVGGPTGPAVVIKTDAVYLGGDPDHGGTFARIATESGYSDKVKAKVG